MPNMPTITVSDAQLARITAAFPGNTNAEKVAAYRDWLKAALRDRLATAELAALAETHNAARKAVVDDVESSLT